MFSRTALCPCTTVLWGAVVPTSIFILLVFGHEFWRRICPLSFLSQIPRALGWQHQIIGILSFIHKQQVTRWSFEIPLIGEPQQIVKSNILGFL